LLFEKPSFEFASANIATLFDSAMIFAKKIKFI